MALQSFLLRKRNRSQMMSKICALPGNLQCPSRLSFQLSGKSHMWDRWGTIATIRTSCIWTGEYYISDSPSASASTWSRAAIDPHPSILHLRQSGKVPMSSDPVCVILSATPHHLCQENTAAVLSCTYILASPCLYSDCRITPEPALKKKAPSITRWQEIKGRKNKIRWDETWRAINGQVGQGSNLGRVKKAFDACHAASIFHMQDPSQCVIQQKIQGFFLSPQVQSFSVTGQRSLITLSRLQRQFAVLRHLWSRAPDSAGPFLVVVWVGVITSTSHRIRSSFTE